MQNAAGTCRYSGTIVTRRFHVRSEQVRLSSWPHGQTRRVCRFVGRGGNQRADIIRRWIRNRRANDIGPLAQKQCGARALLKLGIEGCMSSHNGRTGRPHWRLPCRRSPPRPSARCRCRSSAPPCRCPSHGCRAPGSMSPPSCRCCRQRWR